MMDDFEKENFESVKDLDSDDGWMPISWGAAPMLAALGWMGVIFVYPRVWAIGKAAAIALLSGYGTARGLLNVRETRVALLLSPLFGVLWIGFFWALFTLFDN